MVAADRALEPGGEITIEVNPDDVTPERAEQWRAAGINRISLGVQSHDPAVLEWMHRTHTAEQVPIAVAALRQAGFSNISMDLIFGLPVALDRDLTRDLAATFALEPTHLSLYGLTIEPHTPLATWTSRGEATTVPDERYAVEYLELHQALVAHGFDHYEVSNARLPGHRARHNSAYWEGADYVGIGPAAHSFLNGVRSWNIREWAEYARAAQAGEPARGGLRALDPAARRLEGLYLGLRTTGGLPEELLPRQPGRVAFRRMGGGRARPTPAHGRGVASAGCAGHGDRRFLTFPPWHESASLTERERRVLEAVIETYIATAEPAASKTVAPRSALGDLVGIYPHDHVAP